MLETTICVGLFDKETKRQEITTLDAYKVATNIFVETTGGATITEGRGVYTHHDGTVVVEPTLVCVVFGDDEEQIKKAAGMLKVAFNQESVVIKRVESNVMFF